MSAQEIAGSSAVWRDVDVRPDVAARYLDLVTSAIGQLKRRTVDLLNLSPGMSALDIGCGTGREVELMADRVGSSGRVVGLDASSELVAQATARTAPLGLPVSFQVGDALAMEVPDNSFDAARAERVFQHLTNPARAVGEMVRVVRPGGRVVALDPDWEMLAVSGNRGLGRAVQRYRSEVAITQGTIGRELPGLLVKAGCRDVTFEPACFATSSLAVADTLLFLRSDLDGAVARGWASAEDARAWWSEAEEQDRAGVFYAALHGVIAAGTVAS